jgi:hypothetical protein
MHASALARRAAGAARDVARVAVGARASRCGQNAIGDLLLRARAC